jgi:hypothetical protein
MAKNPYRFTRKEAIERIKEAKSYLCNKERVAFRTVFTKPSEILLPRGYDPRLDESYYNAPPLSDQSTDLLKSRASATPGLTEQDVIQCLSKNFYQGSTSDFVDATLKRALCGSVIELVFYTWVRHDFRPYVQPVVTRFACLWLGTWHHCPIIAWTVMQYHNPVNVEHLPKYIDLIK